MIEKVNKCGDSYWEGKMSVDEIRTILKEKHKLVFLQEGTRVIDVNGNKVEVQIDQRDESILFFLENFERDTLLSVQYDRYDLTIML